MIAVDTINIWEIGQRFQLILAFECVGVGELPFAVLNLQTTDFQIFVMKYENERRLLIRSAYAWK